jgi:transcriptional regulator with XRE-family HTH domain
MDVIGTYFSERESGMTDWGEFLLTIRKGHSLRWVARETGISKTALINIQHGREPRLITLRRLAHAFPEHTEYIVLFLREIVLSNGPCAGVGGEKS